MNEHRISKKTWVFFLVILFFSVVSCHKDDFDFNKFDGPDLEADAAIPLIHTRLTVDDLLPDSSLIVEDSNHLLTLIYETELVSLKAEDYITIPDQHATFIEDNLTIVAPVGVQVTLPFERALTFSPPQSGQRIDSIRIKSGVVSVNYQSGINHSGTVMVTLPDVTKNGLPLQTSFEHVYQGSLPVTGTILLDLSGYTIGLSADTNGVVVMGVNFTLEINGDNNPDLSPYTFQLDANFSNLAFSGIFGYLGQYEYSLADSMSLNIFHNNLEGSIEFSDLKLMISTNNSVGMPLQLKINKLEAYSSIVPPFLVDIADNAAFPNPLNFPSPDITEVGEQADTTFIFTPSNSNLNQAIHLSPQYIYFDVTGKSNPEGMNTVENFVLDTSKFTVTLRVELPFFGSVSNFKFQDTLDFTFEDIEQIQEFSFRLVTRNRFPVEINLQAYFTTDSTYEVLDSLIYDTDPYFLHAAPVGGPPEYRVIENPPPPVYTYSPQPLTRARLSRLTRCKKMIIRAGLNTASNGLVKIYSDYDLDIRLGARIRFKY